MKKRAKWLILFVALLFGIFATGLVVFADDDHKKRNDYEDEGGRNYNYYDDDGDHDHDDDDEDDDEYWEDEDMYGSQYSSPQTGFWNFWMRSAVSYPNVQLPVEVAKNVNMEIDGVKASIYVVPTNGQLLVSGGKLAEALGAKANFYSKSRILVIQRNKTELIVRAGSNAAYENNQKTPMPIQAQYIEKSLYLPISVIANSMGYRVSWNDTEQSLILETI